MKLIIDKKNKIPYILSNIFLIFFDSIGFIIPIFIGYLVDSVLINNNYNDLLRISIFLILVVIIKQAGAYITHHILNRLSLKISSDIKVKCYENINNLDSAFFEVNNKGEIMTSLTSDINRIEKHLGYTYKTIGAVFITFIVSFIYLFSIHKTFTIILLLPGVIILIISFFYIRKLRPKYEELRNLSAACNDYVSDNIEGNRVVKSFAIESSEIKNYEAKTNKYVSEDINVGLMENRFYFWIDSLSYLSIVLFLIGGGYLFINGSITLGEIIIFKCYLYNLRAPFIRMSEFLNSFQRYLVAKKRITKLINAKPTIKLEGKENLKSMLVPIEFKNVKIVYDNKVVLENLNFTIKPYETIAFIGKTGSGKSSIADLLLGFIVPKEGEILINGKNYLEYDIKDIREHIGYVTQNPFLFSDTIYNNISYGKNINKKSAKEYASIACCDYIEKLSEGLDTIIGEKGVGLSGGEKQRLSLARALAVKPDILLLDDITSALDIETEDKINNNIKNLNFNATKVIIASKIVSVMDADKIFVLDNKKVIEQGTHQELLDRKGYYYELYKLGSEGY